MSLLSSLRGDLPKLVGELREPDLAIGAGCNIGEVTGIGEWEQDELAVRTRCDAKGGRIAIGK